MKESEKLNKAMFDAIALFEKLEPNAEQLRGGKPIPYANLHAVVNSIQKSLLKNEIKIDTHIKRVEGEGKETDRDIVTTLIHIPSNESESFTWPITLSNPSNNQELGAAHTYGRRYNLCGAFNLTIETDPDDNDGVIETKEASADEISEGIKAEEVQLLAELTAELNSAATRDELQEIWKKKTEARKKLGPFLKQVIGIAKDKLKDDLQDAA